MEIHPATELENEMVKNLYQNNITSLAVKLDEILSFLPSNQRIASRCVFTFNIFRAALVYMKHVSPEAFKCQFEPLLESLIKLKDDKDLNDGNR